jgi:hypothetical protein
MPGARVRITVPAYAFTVDKSALRKALRAAGVEVASVARALIRKSQKSAPGLPPVSRSGALASHFAVKVDESGEGVTIRNKMFYSLFLEMGARGGGGDTHNKANILPAGETNWRGRVLRSKNRMKKSAINRSRPLLPHPFLAPALAQREDSIAQRIEAAVVEGVKFKRLKA